MKNIFLKTTIFAAILAGFMAQPVEAMQAFKQTPTWKKVVYVGTGVVAVFGLGYWTYSKLTKNNSLLEQLMKTEPEQMRQFLCNAPENNPNILDQIIDELDESDKIVNFLNKLLGDKDNIYVLPDLLTPRWNTSDFVNTSAKSILNKLAIKNKNLFEQALQYNNQELRTHRAIASYYKTQEQSSSVPQQKLEQLKQNSTPSTQVSPKPIEIKKIPKSQDKPVETFDSSKAPQVVKDLFNNIAASLTLFINQQYNDCTYLRMAIMRDINDEKIVSQIPTGSNLKEIVAQALQYKNVDGKTLKDLAAKTQYESEIHALYMRYKVQ